MNKKATSTLLMSSVIYLVLLVIFLAPAIYFVYSLINGASIWGDYYAKEIAKTINLAKDRDEIIMDIHKGTVIARRNSVNQNEIIKVDNEKNEVCVKLSERKTSCYSYYNSVDVAWSVELGVSGNVLNLVIAKGG